MQTDESTPCEDAVDNRGTAQLLCFGFAAIMTAAGWLFERGML